MKARSAVAVGLLAVSGMAAAAPATKGVNGPLGDELFYNYLEGNFNQVYTEIDGNERVVSDSGFGVAGSVFIYQPLYLLADYRYSDYSFVSAGSPTKLEWEHTSVGLGARLPISYNTDLFANGTYELFNKKRKPGLATSATTQEPVTVEYDGVGAELGLRGFISGFAEVSASFRYSEVESDKRVAGGRRETLKDRVSVLSLTIPMFNQVSLFLRGEYGVSYSNLRDSANPVIAANHKDFETETFMLGARYNFRLPH